ncbi:MAG: porin [Campylobacteraceae bacterium]|nr:porin [Campylobacteraceae bacterium]
MKKLVRMSLVAAVAVAGFTTSASAVEGLSTSGKFVVKVQAATDKLADNTKSLHDIDFDVKLNQKINDNLSGVVVVQGDSKQKTNESASKQNINISNAYFNYDNSGFNATLGLQDINTPVTDGELGAGLLVTYSPVENVTLAAAHFLSNEIVAKSDISALALIVSAGPVNLELWRTSISGYKATTSATIGGTFGPVSVDALYAVTSDESGANGDDGKTAKISLGFDAGVAEFRAAYYTTDKKGGALATDTGAQTAFELDEFSLTGEADAKAFMIGATVPVSDFNISLDYLSADYLGNMDASELAFGVNTKVAKTTTVSVGYSMVEVETESVTTKEENIASFKVKYTF